ncbi:olfactory receptor 5AR1-like [Anomaloglossus baeobatrachus]|uniref:olfactory receptor 5AR1-like n=1 Tax=Anomaloglossus baeobatrachus TaxID=238106 RepID=UPI003F502A0B
MNRTIADEFILLGFSDDPAVNIPLFLLFLVLYLITVTGNVLIVSLIVATADLHTPMYFFLCVLSVVDLCMSTSVVPRLLMDLFSSHRSISLGACVLQFYIVLLMSGAECLLLALMAYDRYTAICQPLHYPVLMRWSICYRLTATVLITSFMIFIIPPLLKPMDLCYPNHINHFMCEVLALMQLACDNIYFMSVLKIRSSKRSKAFSTCTSHISVVILFFGTGMIMYFRPVSLHSSSNREKYISVAYVIVTPMLNPVIYSLNNRDVKATFRKVLSKPYIPDEGFHTETAVGLLAVHLVACSGDKSGFCNLVFDLNMNDIGLHFTYEMSEDKLAFLHILVEREPDGHLSTSTYRKKTSSN